MDQKLRFFNIEVCDDSMAPKINKGNFVVFDLKKIPDSGKICLAYMEGKLIIRRLFIENRRVFLRPENRSYPEIEIYPRYLKKLYEAVKIHSEL